MSFFIFVDMAFKATFMTKFTSPVGPRTSVSLREYTDGRFKVCFYQTVFKKQQNMEVERTLSLDVVAWRKFVNHLVDVDQVIADIQNGGGASLDLDILDDVRLRINPSYPFINLRKFWTPPNRDEKIPTTSGICLKFDDYFILKSLIPALDSLLPDRASADSCGSNAENVSRTMSTQKLQKYV